uniref:CCHC-type domain-containing protein n=1 Tax=Prolemur simus TaxID=1328070 RepID=A0A8C9DFC7_PROSS
MTRWARVTIIPHITRDPCLREPAKTYESVNNLKPTGYPLKLMHPKQNIKRTKRKREYLNEDVNGFMEYLRQNSQMVHNGEIIATDVQKVREEIAVGTGMCYRGRSTEHEITKCKAKVDPALGEFPFAKCFVCGEMGDLSRSCPDNPKGLYVDEFRSNGHGCWAKGVSAEYEETLDAPNPQNPKTKILKIVNF